ncbi:MAG TPA: hypothetical protein VNL72_00110 [Gammaproteobacteria bacterium]|nr:hypothetical protein [Gammaproteobacteria bacterium]
MPVRFPQLLPLAPDTPLPGGIDAFVFEQDTELILRLDLEFQYPRESYRELIAEASAGRAHPPGSVVVREGVPLYLFAIVHDLACDPTWKEEWVRRALENVFQVAAARRVERLVMPLLGTVHGRLAPERSLRMLVTALRAAGSKPPETVYLHATTGPAMHRLLAAVLADDQGRG